MPSSPGAVQVLAHLAAETAYTKAALADTEALQAELYTEMRARIQEEDQGVPYRSEHLPMLHVPNLYQFGSPSLKLAESHLNCFTMHRFQMSHAVCASAMTADV